MQYPDLQGGGALGDALTPGTPAGSMAASAHGGTYSHVAVVGGASGGERGAASATAAAAARRRRAAPAGEAVTPPRSAPAHGGRGGRHGARAGGWDRMPRDGAPLAAPLDGVRNRRRAAATEAGAQARSSETHCLQMIARFRAAFVGQASAGRSGNRLSQRWALVRPNEEPHESEIVVGSIFQNAGVLSRSPALLTALQTACR